jgi:hypothetical protein
MDGDVIRQGDDVLVLCIFCGRYIPGGVYRAPEDVMFADLMEGPERPPATRVRREGGVGIAPKVVLPWWQWGSPFRWRWAAAASEVGDRLVVAAWAASAQATRNILAGVEVTDADAGVACVVDEELDFDVLGADRDLFHSQSMNDPGFVVNELSCGGSVVLSSV